MRDFFLQHFRRLDHPGPLWDLNPSPVNLHVHHPIFGRKVLRELLYRACRFGWGFFAHDAFAGVVWFTGPTIGRRSDAATMQAESRCVK